MTLAYRCSSFDLRSLPASPLPVEKDRAGVSEPGDGTFWSNEQDLVCWCSNPGQVRALDSPNGDCVQCSPNTLVDGAGEAFLAYQGMTSWWDWGWFLYFPYPSSSPHHYVFVIDGPTCLSSPVASISHYSSMTTIYCIDNYYHYTNVVENGIVLETLYILCIYYTNLYGGCCLAE